MPPAPPSHCPRAPTAVPAPHDWGSFAMSSPCCFLVPLAHLLHALKATHAPSPPGCLGPPYWAQGRGARRACRAGPEPGWSGARVCSSPVVPESMPPTLGSQDARGGSMLLWRMISGPEHPEQPHGHLVSLPHAHRQQGRQTETAVVPSARNIAQPLQALLSLFVR